MTDIKDTDIAAYIDGTLDAKKRTRLEQQFAASPETLDAFCRLGLVAAYAAGALDPVMDPALPVGLLEGVKQMYPVAQNPVDAVIGYIRDALAVFHTSAGTLGLLCQPAGLLRSGEIRASQAVLIKKTIADIQVELLVERKDSGDCNLSISVADYCSAPLQSLRADILTNNRVLASELLSSGRVRCDDVGPGSYRVAIRKNHSSIGDITITINGPERGGADDR